MAQQRFMRDGRWMTEDELKTYNAQDSEVIKSEEIKTKTKKLKEEDKVRE